MKRRVLIVEDDEVFLRPLRRALELEGFDVLTAGSGEEALDRLKREDVDLALTDQRLPGMDGVQVVRRLKAEHPEIGVVVMTAYGTIGAAVEATRLGAEDYLVKPFEPDEILLVLRRALEFRDLRDQRRQSFRRNQERFTLTNLVAKSPKMLEILALLHEVAQLDTTVLIDGETGVGKELLARTLHFSGPRREKPFVAVNCAAIPEELFESELFGYRRGAFTGATEPRRGHFQLASGGTLLLDEIGEMPLGLQSKLLRAIEEKKITPIGAERPVDIDVRFIATTNQDLREAVERGAFRRDLFYRLAVFPLRVPPLRERVEDIPAARGPLPGRERPAVQEDHAGIRAGGPRRPGALSVAGERAGARERRGARGHRRARGRDRRRRAVPGAERRRSRGRRSDPAVPGGEGPGRRGVRAGLRGRGPGAPRRQALRGGPSRRHGQQEPLGEDGALRPSLAGRRGRAAADIPS